MKNHNLLSSVILCIWCALSSNTTASPIILYDGSTSPELQGWTQNTLGSDNTGSHSVNTDGAIATFSTSNKSVNSYAIETGATDFIVSMRVKVESADWNPY